MLVTIREKRKYGCLNESKNNNEWGKKAESSSSFYPIHARLLLLPGMPAALEEEKRTGAAAVWSTDSQQDAQTPIPSAARCTEQQGLEAACVSLPKAGALFDGQPSGPIAAPLAWNVGVESQWREGREKGRTADRFIIDVFSHFTSNWAFLRLLAKNLIN